MRPARTRDRPGERTSCARSHGSTPRRTGLASRYRFRRRPHGTIRDEARSRMLQRAGHRDDWSSVRSTRLARPKNQGSLGVMPFGSNPDEVEGSVEVGDFRETHILRIHGLNKVGTAEVKKAGIIGFGEALLERGQVHAAEVRIILECSPDVDDEDLVVAKPSGCTFIGCGSNLLNEARELGWRS